MADCDFQPAFLRAMPTATRPIGVDRETGNGVIRGYVVAEVGDFKSGRGSFDGQSLSMIAEQINSKAGGLKSHFTHATLSADGLGKSLGRAKNARVDGNSVRADLHLSASSRKTPNGDLGGYVMDLAEEDASALGSSLVIHPKIVRKLDAKGKPAVDEQGREVPPLWLPIDLRASDVVGDGDAVHGSFLSAGLSAGDLPDAAVWQGAYLLDGMFPGKTRAEVEAKLQAWLGRYLDLRYAMESEQPNGERLTMRRRILRLKELASSMP